MRPALLALVLLTGCAHAPARIAYVPPEPLACAQALAAAALRLASGPCKPPAPDALTCALATAAEAVGAVACQPVPVMLDEAGKPIAAPAVP